MSDEAAKSIDLHKVLMEIDEEVRAKRASGELPADLERELDMAFARFAPAGALDGDFDQLLDRAEAQAFFDLIAPLESSRPGVPYVKRIVQKSVRWYFRYVVEQITSFGHSLTRAVRQLGERVSALEQLTAPADELAAIQGRNPSSIDENWYPTVLQALRSIKGRVLHARCGAGDLVKALQESGIDAYGVDPISELVATGTSNVAGSASSLDLRPDDERDHLRSINPGALDGLVLSTCVDTLPRGAQVELADLAAITLRHGGVLVLLTANPKWWELQRSPLERDLAFGSPMHVETWKHLLQDRGFTIRQVVDGSSSTKLAHTGDEVMDANLDLINSVLFPPASTLVVAQR